jgi:EmrB/QacA subfamily drug resistance transporter
MARVEQSVKYGTPTGRWVIAATVLGSGIAFLDSTVVNVALPAIEDDLGGGLSGLQWTIDSYMLFLGGFLLLGGSLGDVFGRRKIFVFGLIGFAISSALCALAPTIETLIAARGLQGLTGALLVPGSLAIISTSFDVEHRAQAVGAWSGLAGVTTAVGPFIGGWMIESANWRLIFLINLPLAAIAIWIAIRHIPETRAEGEPGHIDYPGAVTAALGLGGVIYALIEGPVKGFSDTTVIGALVIGVLCLAAFPIIESRHKDPMLPLSIFRSRQFTGANAATLAVYFSLSGAIFLVIIQLQEGLGYSPVAAGTSLIPMTILLLTLSSSAGKIATRIGPRIPMTGGPIVAAVGLAMFSQISEGASYWTTVLPAATVFGLGLALTVAPLTATVLAGVESRHAGVGSGVNNAVARIAGLLAVALLPFLGGLTGEEPGTADFSAGYERAVLIAAVICAAGGVISWLVIRRPSVPTVAVPSSLDHPCHSHEHLHGHLVETKAS